MELTTIHTIGDSHCQNGWRDLHLPMLKIKMNWQGPKTMHGVATNGLKNLAKACDVGDGEIVVFSYGEIDCRCHIHKHGGIASAQELAEKYLDAVASCRELHGGNPIVWIQGIIPPPRKAEGKDNPNMPFEGTDEERLAYTNAMNVALISGCVSRGFIFIDLPREYADDVGFLDHSKSDGHVHIGSSDGLAKLVCELLNRE